MNPLKAYKKIRRSFIKKYTLPKHRKILEIIPEKSKVLDLGCGNCRLSKMLLRKKCRVTGSDISKLKLKIKNLKYIQADLNKKFSFRSKVDVVILSDFLEHLKKTEEVLKKCAMITGKIIVSIPNLDYFLYKIAPQLENPPGDLEHVHHWTTESFKKIIPVELKIDKIEYCSDFPEFRWINYLLPNKRFFNQTIIMVLKAKTK